MRGDGGGEDVGRGGVEGWVGESERADTGLKTGKGGGVAEGVEAVAVDDGVVFEKAEEAGFWVAGLGFGSDGADLDVAEAEVEEPWKEGREEEKGEKR
jgi:hypothetical protein